MLTTPGEDWHALHRRLLALRREVVVPLLGRVPPGHAERRTAGPGGLEVRWRLDGGGVLTLVANLAERPQPWSGEARGQAFFHTHEGTGGTLPSWYVAWYRGG